jgi:hypothetical protein
MLLDNMHESENTNNAILGKIPTKISGRDRCDKMGLPRLKRFLHTDAYRALATKQNDAAYVGTSSCQRSHQGLAGRPAPSSADIRNLAKDPIALDGTVDDDVSDMNTAWPEFAREGLADHPQACIGSGERSKCCSSAKSC